MSKINFNYKIPEKSIIANNFDRIDYMDCCYISSNLNYLVNEYLTKLFVTPEWVNELMRLRNIIVKPFGLKTEIDPHYKKPDNYSVGDKTELFTVADRNENEIVLAENDKHLNFKVSIFVDKQNDHNLVYMTTLVKFNNFGGRLYFFFVKPFHKIIVKATMKKYLNTYEK